MVRRDKSEAAVCMGNGCVTSVKKRERESQPLPFSSGLSLYVCIILIGQ